MASSLMPTSNSPSDITDVTAVVDESATGSREARRVGRVGLWALLVFFGGFLLWAVWAPLDEGVPGEGIVTLDTKSKTVQHLNGGLVREVLVREGDQVREGQLLMRLDDATARADYEAVRQRYLGERALQGRLQAEKNGRAMIEFHPDLQKAADDPLIRQQMHNQEQLLQTRRSLLQSDLQSIEESVAGQQGMLLSYDRTLQNRRSQLALVNDELDHLRGLVAEGYAPRNRQLELERTAADVLSFIADLEGNIVRAQRSIAELRQRALSRQRDMRREVETQLSDVNSEVLADEQKLIAVAEQLARTEIRAPTGGQVVGLTVQTVGGVVQPGQKLMDIVPDNRDLLLEARVAPNLIDRVHAGLPVDVRFHTFAHSPQLVVDGEVLSVSGDLLTDQHTGFTYYLARVKLTAHGIRQLEGRQMQPGMPVQVVFRTGERSMLTYLINPLIKRVSSSLKEE